MPVTQTSYMLNWDISVSNWDSVVLPAFDAFKARYCDKVPSEEVVVDIDYNQAIQSIAGYLNDYQRSAVRPYCVIMQNADSGIYQLVFPHTKEVWICNCSRGDLLRFIQNLDKDVGKLR